MNRAWHEVSKSSDFNDGAAIVADIKGKQIAVFKLGADFFAIDNRCAHRGGPLAEGYIENGLVRCPWHAWLFDVRTGQCRNAPDGGTNQNRYIVKVEEGRVWVQC